MGVEVGEAKETPHIQGYVSFKSAKSKRSMYKWMSGDATKKFWIEKRRGTPQKASTYCFKEGGKKFEFGEVPVGMGKRTDLTNTAEALMDGANLRDIIDEQKVQAVQYAKLWLTYNEEERPH